jgi:phosphohistidine swiveling domain-containing protein
MATTINKPPEATPGDLGSLPPPPLTAEFIYNQLTNTGIGTVFPTPKPVAKAVHVNAYSTGISKRLHGGKAYGLFCLTAQGIAIPATWVIPVEYSLSRPEAIDLGSIKASSYAYAEFLYAVRSGAPVSMPGMMDTKLNVAWSDLPQAVREVWASWDSPRARAYREAKGISDTLGTAVVIQKMVPAKYSGVAFTNHPNNVHNKPEFEPQVEYVEGFGTALVDGSGVAQNFLDNPPVPALVPGLLAQLKKIHYAFGPSDVEWVVSATHALYFVQQRPLVFVDPPQPTATIDETGRTVLFQRKAIGAPVRVTGRVGYEFVYARNFTPELTAQMIASRGILTFFSGLTCHASIVSRTLGLPAIGGLREWEASSLSGRWVTLDGATGKVLEATAEEIAAAATPTEKASLAAVPAPPVPLLESRTPNLAIPKRGVYNVQYLFQRFYAHLEQFLQGQIPPERMEFVAQEIAEVLCVYLYLATCGESRHLHRYEAGYQHIANLTKAGLVSKGGYSKNRDGWVRACMVQPKNVQEALTIAQAVLVAFESSVWNSSGFGGRRWAAISKVLVAYLQGELTPVLFVDSCFNLQHNNGTVFGKFAWLMIDSMMLRNQLDARRNGDSLEPFYNPNYKITKTTVFAETLQLLSKVAPVTEDGEPEHGDGGGSEAETCSSCGAHLDEDGNCPNNPESKPQEKPSEPQDETQPMVGTYVVPQPVYQSLPQPGERNSPTSKTSSKKGK